MSRRKPPRQPRQPRSPNTYSNLPPWLREGFQGLENAFSGVERVVGLFQGPGAKTQEQVQQPRPRRLPERDPFNVKEAKPRKFKSPRTLAQICSWLSAQGLPNRFYEGQSQDLIDNIEAVTLHVRGEDGELRDYPIQLLPEWRNPVAGSGSSRETP